MSNDADKVAEAVADVVVATASVPFLVVGKVCSGICNAIGSFCDWAE
jgi:hypothetical protein